MLVVAALLAGRHCVIAARRHFRPAESAKTFMPTAPPPHRSPDLNLMSYFSKLPSLSSHGAFFSCSEQSRVGCFGGVGDGVELLIEALHSFSVQSYPYVPLFLQYNKIFILCQ